MTAVRILLTREQQALLAEVRELPATRADVFSRRWRAGHLRDDMEGAGNEGLWRGAQKFSAAEGISFPPYACACVDHAIFRFMRREVREQRLRASASLVAAWGGALVVGRSDDELDPTEDDDVMAAKKLASYVDAKTMSAAATLAAEWESAQEGSERSILMRDLAAALREELLSCNERDQRFFVALYGQGRTVEEAAADVGLPYGTAKARQRKLLTQLREALERRGYEWVDKTA